MQVLQLFWMTPESFDHIIKVKIPAPICLLQPMNGQLKFTYMSSIPRIIQTSLLYRLQLFLNVAIREHGFFIPLSISQLKIIVRTILNRLRHRHLRQISLWSTFEFVKTVLWQIDPYRRLSFRQRLFCRKTPFTLNGLNATKNIPKSLLSHCTWVSSRIIYGS